MGKVCLLRHQTRLGYVLRETEKFYIDTALAKSKVIISQLVS